MIVQAQVGLESLTGLAADTAQNFWYADIATPSETNLNLFRDAIYNFYNTDYGDVGYGNNQPIRFYLARSISLGFRVTFYDADASPKAPLILPQTLTLTDKDNSNNPYPSQVALRLSIHAASVVGVRAGSLRGGVFLGPLMSGANNSPGSPYTVRPASGLVNAMRTAAHALLVASAAAAPWTWVVYSKANSAGYPVVGGHVGDRFDIIRRRAASSETRNLWT